VIVLLCQYFAQTLGSWEKRNLQGALLSLRDEMHAFPWILFSSLPASLEMYCAMYEDFIAFIGANTMRLSTVEEG